MGIRLIAIDIDGTLLPSTGGAVTARTRAALKAAEAQGIEIVIATGRREAFALPRIEPIGLNKEGVLISSNGAVMRRFDGLLMDRRFMSVEAARGVCSEMRDHGTLVFTFDRQGPGALVLEGFERADYRLARWIEANRSHMAEIAPLERAFACGEAPIQGMLCGSVRQMKDAEERLLGVGFGSSLSMHRTEYAERDLSILDLLPHGCSKASALELLARKRGLCREEVMAIGDNLNDLEMLDYAGRGVLMANAGQEMLAMAADRGWEQAASCDDEGVALVIESVIAESARRGLAGQGGSGDRSRGRSTRCPE